MGWMMKQLLKLRKIFLKQIEEKMITLISEKGITLFINKDKNKVAFDDGSSDPYDNYAKPDFDFDDKKRFKYKIHGDLNLTKHNENKIIWREVQKILSFL